MNDGMCSMKFRRKSRNFDLTTVEYCSFVDLGAKDTHECILAVAHDVVRDWSLPWRKDMSRRKVASVEEGRDVERIRGVSTMNVLC